MQITSRNEASRTELSVVPLVNVVFLLLVFFMLVGQVVSPEPMKVDPPRSRSGADDPGQAVKVLMTSDGRIALNQEIVPRDRLSRRVAEMLAGAPRASFQVKADARADSVEVIRVMEALRAAGVERLTLLTERRFR